jgi:hypothetical protein
MSDREDMLLDALQEIADSQQWVHTEGVNLAPDCYACGCDKGAKHGPSCVYQMARDAIDSHERWPDE